MADVTPDTSLFTSLLRKEKRVVTEETGQHQRVGVKPCERRTR